jgi:hypothetical protein
LKRLPIPAAHLIYPGLSLLIASMIGVAFWPGYLRPLLSGRVEEPLYIHVHAAVFFGFVALFITQSVLAATGRLELHRKVGKAGIYYGLAMVPIGIITVFSQISSSVAAGRMEEAQTALLTPLMDMLVFPAFFGAAALYRRRPELHKRLMLVAITILIDSSVSRIEVPYRELIWAAPILLGIGYDLISKRMLHPVYVLGLATIYLMLLRRFFVNTEAWRGISGWLIALVF